jgi:erythromycin esterase-like protein
MPTRDDIALNAVCATAITLTGDDGDYDALIERARDARLVLLGEASHGTHEFYHERARITRRLVDELGFDAVAVEADWPDAYLVDCYVRGADDVDAEHALRGFRRFPQWMWRNEDVVALVEWMRDRNAALDPVDHVGFYGVDLYSLHASIEAVLTYLWKVDPEAAKRARERYSCFEHFGQDPQSYGYATSLGAEGCEEDVVRQLVELQQSASRYRERPAFRLVDEQFVAEQNARLVKNAERYYRSMFRGRVSSWNLRDSHMADTVEALLTHLGRDGHESRLVVWAHNSHLGDARATEMGARGEHNVGQLLRERFGPDVFSVGFTTHTGTVTAASDWDAPAELKNVVPSLAGSYERLLHDCGRDRFYLPLSTPDLRKALREPRLERAIGVIYRPETERASHYFHARLSDQFDGVIHIDETSAVTPLERTGLLDDEEIPETYPSAL